MAKAKAVDTGTTEPKSKTLSKLLSTRAEIYRFDTWLVGTTPLISHAWSEKAKREMLQKQVKATRGGREERNPEADFISSLYEMAPGQYGFPVTAFKAAIVEACHKDKGIAKTTMQGALYFDADIVRVRPALAGAVCDMPLVRIYGSKPEMREDMVRIGVGMQKTANLAYRAQFSTWAVHLTGQLNTTQVPLTTFANAINDAGLVKGVGEWRNEHKGVFGAFRLASEAEELAWSRFASGKGPLPGVKPVRLVA